MALGPGTRLGAYEILTLLGRGGMGEVYRARDTKLGRDVAIKVLLPAVANDPDRLARFSREAQVLASLNHPNIAHIHGLEESDGVRALVMELVEGPTLADRIARGAIPLDEALPIAKQIAEALEAAHEQGIVHRDLKPANIKVRADGTVKVLDFGLAKAMDTAGASSVGATMSPTVSMHATQAGIILGTAAYMAPEQAKGKPVDARADIWAFGAVLYEMLSGSRAFTGEDISDTLVAVLSKDPDWARLPSGTPARVRDLLRRCLERDAKRRLQAIGEARIHLDDLLSGKSDPPALGETSPVNAPRRTLLVTIPLVLGALVASLVSWLVLHHVPEALHPMRFSIVPPAAEPFYVQGLHRNLAISPDGTHVVYVAKGGGGTQLMVRAIDQLEAVPLRGITDAGFPFLSPDGRWVGFFTGGSSGGSGELKKVAIAGGPPITLCRYTGGPRGASWGADDTIVFATNELTTGLMSVRAGGGEPKMLTKPDAAHGEQDHVFPSLLPGGRAVLFTITAAGGVDNAQIAVFDVTTGQSKTLIRGGSDAQYVETGHLVYASAGSLRAVRFDPARLDVLSDPVPVVEQVMTVSSGAADFRISQQGTLVYVAGGPGGQAGGQRSLVWVNRQGREQPINAPLRGYLSPRLSPDGTRVALDTRDQDDDIWIWDLGRQTLARLTFESGLDGYAVWTPDGRRIAFSSSRASGIINLFWQSADGTGTAERLTTSLNTQYPTSFSPDGKSLVFQENNAKTSADVMVLHLGGTPWAEPLIHTPFGEYAGDVSPDGRWIAYYSNETGRDEVYVRPFPNVDGGHFQMSTGGGSRPAWSKNGRELFYLSPTTAMMAVAVQTAPTFGAGNPTKLFDGPWTTLPTTRTYDVSSDGQRFLLIREGAAGDQRAASPTITVVVNWSAELKAKLPTK